MSEMYNSSDFLQTPDFRFQTSNNMNINRHNYEEYFILYLDNELEVDERGQVEVFAQQNPDLKAELDMLLQSKLNPDASIHFEDKGSLMRFENASVTLTNYEEWLTSYIDNELNEEERNHVEQFLTANPAIQKELSLLQQVKLQPEAIIFPNKESLYRREEKAPRIVVMRWQRIAVAAVLLFAISITAIVVLNKKDNDAANVATSQPKEQKPNNNNAVKPNQIEIKGTQEQIAQSDEKKVEPQVKRNATQLAVATKNVAIPEKKNQPSPAVEVKEQELIANNIETRTTNNLPQPESKTIVDSKAETNTIAANVAQNDPALTKNTGNSGNTDVTSLSSKPSDNPEVSTQQDTDPGFEYASNNNSNRKGGLRGFFRKVTRTFEKKANLKSSDGEEDGRLLIAGLAIKLKN